MTTISTIDPDLLEAWRHLWVNRSQPYALQRANGTYRWVQRPVTDALLSAHLAGGVTLALSSSDARGWCRWLCLDVDTPDTLSQLLLLRAALADQGLPGLVEASRRGGHLWLFLEEALPVVEVRWTLLEACEQLRAAGTCVLPAYELYPAASAAVAGTLGQPVRLPLGVHQLTGTRYPLFDAEGHPCAFTSPEAALRFMLAWPRVSVSRVQQAWRRFVGGGSGSGEDRASGNTLPYTDEEDETSLIHLADLAYSAAGTYAPTAGRVGTSSAVIRWVDAHVSPLELLAELAPETALRRVGQGWLGWCPFHDDRAPDALGRPGTPSFYVVHNRRYGWSWRCLSTNCAHSLGPMRHSFRLFQELRRLAVTDAIAAALGRWEMPLRAGAGEGTGDD
jgi:hypothetical protein